LLSSKIILLWTGADVVRRCAQGEEALPDVSGVRERVLRIGRVAQALKDGDELAAEVCVRWLIGAFLAICRQSWQRPDAITEISAQLKVNLRPLWSPAAEALAQVSERCGNVVWRLLFEELRTGVEGARGTEIPEWMKMDQDDEPQHGIYEDEKIWRDPSAHKLLVVVGEKLNDGGINMELIEVCLATGFYTSLLMRKQDQRCAERFDAAMYENQLIAALGVSHSLAEKHNRDLIPFFLNLVDGPPISRQKLAAWLGLLGKFSNPKATHGSERLHAFYVSLLAHADRALQTAALTCLITFRSPVLVRKEDILRALLDETRWRDELANLDLDTLELHEREEVVGVTIRLLFGVMLEKRARGRGADRRSAVLTVLGGCTDSELGLLVELMLKPLERVAVTERQEVGDAPSANDTSDKQRIGFLHLLADVLKNLAPRLIVYWPSVLSMVLTLVADAQKRLDTANHDLTGHVESAEADEEVEDDDGLVGTNKAARTIRQMGIKRFTDFFRCPINFNFTPYLSRAFEVMISPRVDRIDVENTQSPSALLELFLAWADKPEYARLLVAYDARVLPKVYDCLVATNVKPAVISRILDIVERLLDHADGDNGLSEEVLKPQVSCLLSNVAEMLQRNKEIAAGTHALSQRLIGVLSRLALYLSDSAQAAKLLSLLSPLLRKSHKVINDRVKTDVLKVVQRLLPFVPDSKNSESSLFNNIYETLAQLFQTLRARPGRLALVAAFHQVATVDASMIVVSDVLENLNAYSARRMEEPDFDRRIKAFSYLNDTLHTALSVRDWPPLLYNSLHFIQDPNELVIRNNAALTLRHFIDKVATKPASDLERTFLRTLYPALKNGLRTKSELVRAEVLGVIAHAVRTCGDIASLQEMRGLLADGDEEANFFNNVLHVQVHRRTRALRRLADHAETGHLRSTTLAEMFVPLVGNFIATADTLDHHLVNEAITATGRLSRQLAWGAYYTLVQQYLRLSKEKDGSERVYIRTLVAILDNFHFSMDDIDEELRVGEDSGEAEHRPSHVAATGKIADAVNLRLLPALLNHLENRKEAEESIRIPIAVGVVKVALHLPERARGLQIEKLLTVLSQILRSKSQETRDLTRETLCRITAMLGPSYLATVVKELRIALARGPQLHVVAYTAHTLLTYVTAEERVKNFGTLDSCVADVVHVSAEVIFGESGKDVQSEDFKTKMREVRAASGKALDAFSILARYVTSTRVSNLLLPVRSIMQETMSHKVLQQVEDVLRRIAIGLNANKHVTPTDLLALCHTLISQNAKFLQEAPRKQQKSKRDHVTVQLKRKLTSGSGHLATNAFRYVEYL
jgi:U3 small nucleolar RNA-associated protein 20